MRRQLLPIRFDDSVIVRSGSAAALRRAVEYAVESGADVISMSVGGEALHNRGARDAMDAAATAGVILVAAAGNGSAALTVVTEPGAWGATIAVTASNAWGQPWSGANYGPLSTSRRRARTCGTAARW